MWKAGRWCVKSQVTVTTANKKHAVSNTYFHLFRICWLYDKKNTFLLVSFPLGYWIITEYHHPAALNDLNYLLCVKHINGVKHDTLMLIILLCVGEIHIYKMWLMTARLCLFVLQLKSSERSWCFKWVIKILLWGKSEPEGYPGLGY